ncbi:hypothetical protein M3650_05195 [Paenibacillus sp. MER TA 81-3]|uniref:hypothetical protein n=1 Tax=Paenibacillus sp. MER TA 81-3 TaxID=2939573 RepID=UPI00203DF638|nr:hypothetical protein [Paenibacillus sp. MER TA 81-3]MCM3338048.1 hypothetical protein [Paenibacillus sp. MER TA 81-3]
MVKNNKANRMNPANAKYNSEFGAESVTSDTEFGAESVTADTEFGAESVTADTEFGADSVGNAGAINNNDAMKNIVKKTKK